MKKSDQMSILSTVSPVNDPNKQIQVTRKEEQSLKIQ
jgi:hypothetical protein